MSLGFFDAGIRPAGWLEDEGEPRGWFDRTLLQASATSQPQRLTLWKPVALMALGFFAQDDIQASTQKSLHAYRSPAAAAASGHSVRTTTQLVIVDGEQDAVRVNHNRRLLYGKAPAAATVQPLRMWAPLTQRVEAEDDARRGDHSLLHRYRTGYQTVGQNYRLWPGPQKRVDAEEYAVLSVGTFAGQAVTSSAQLGQPWYLWKPQPRVNEEEDIRRGPDHARLHLYRTGYQTVGQGYRLWPAPQQRTEVEEYTPTKPSSLMAFRAAVASAGQPWHLWKPQVRHTAPEEYLVLNQGAAAGQEGTAQVTGPGQPWYLWKAQARPIEAEEYTVPKPSVFALARVTQPTVTQQWFIYPPAVSSQSVEDDPYRSDQHKLHRYRAIAPTAGPGQPWYLWVPPIPRIAPEEYLVLSQGAAAGQEGTAPAAPTAGQPWYLWKQSLPRIEPEDDARRGDQTQLHRYRAAIPQQWFIYPPVAAPQDVEADPYRVDQHRIHRYRNLAVIAPSGTPLWFWPAAKADQAVEPNPVVRDHAAALYPFRPHDAIEPPVVVPPVSEHGFEIGGEIVKRPRRNLVYVLPDTPRSSIQPETQKAKAPISFEAAREKAAAIIEEAAQQHAAAVMPESVRYGSVRGALKPLAKALNGWNWISVYQRLYDQALLEQLRAEFVRLDQLEEDDAIAFLLLNM